MPSEDQIHRECAAWVFAHEALLPQLRWLTHVPNGGKRSRGEAGKMRAMGVRKGVVDWLLPFSSPKGLYRGLAIEIKSQKGALSDEQDEFLQTALADGWLVGVARSLEQFTELVMKWQSDRS
ncbi:MAG: VRR-NUC domain-containing protein [Burkholderiaceae bacterium]|nr:MAG: VRR-NUC domain-containing protein [Burkholderiaceae bacterium]TBR76825.1 MAG: VRR-NUC domain-containing protein [Burkholderiaceae bacterium]